jgi:hypothetical protein
MSEDTDSQEFFNKVMDEAEAEEKPWTDFQAQCKYKDRPVRLGRPLPLCLEYGCLCGEAYCPEWDHRTHSQTNSSKQTTEDK